MSAFQITLKAQELAALREVVEYLDDEVTDFEQRGRPKGHIGIDVKTLAADQKHQSDGRLARLFEIMFPGETVTVTGEGGKTLFSAEEHETEEEEEEDEGDEGEKDGKDAEDDA